jgi:acetyltransferase-like isoleucine patch superfamily enzyme
VELIRKILYIFRDTLLYFRNLYFGMLGADIHPQARISFKARIDFTNAKGVHIRKGAHITFDSIILTHDFCRGIWKDTYIEENCFIGAGSIILPGVRIGRESIVAAGSVVTKDVPPNVIVAGNPAVIIRKDIRTEFLGRIVK